MSEVAPAPPQPFDPATFDPWSQNVTMYAPDGSSVVVSMENVNTYRLYTARVSTSFGSQTGASVVLLLVLLLLTKREKRKSSIFILNCLCLVLNSLRCIFLVCYVTGGFMHPYTLLTGVGRYSTSDVVVSVMGTTLTTMVTTCIMASLSLQTWVACITTSKLQRVLIMSITTTMALISVGTKFAYMVAANISVVQLSMRDTDKLSALSYITQAVTILLYSFVFVWKLGYAVVQRRRLKMQQFGPMQIVFIMGCQTLIIPALFTAASFLRPVTDKIPEVGTLVITILCVFLPLSAIWAGVANDSAIAYRGPDAHHHLINSQFGRNGAGTLTSSTTAFDKSRQMSCSTCSYVKKTEDFDLSEYSPAGKGGITEDDGIHVDHQYTVHHETIPLERV